MAGQDEGLATLGKAAAVGLALGTAALGYLATRRSSGNDGDDAPGYSARRTGSDVAGRTVTIRKGRQELYDFWRNFPNLVGVMENVTAIQVRGERTVWTIRAPGGGTVEVETEVTEDRAGEVIAWRSVEGSQITTHGRVTFADAPGERGTRVTLVIDYAPPLGELGRMVAKIAGREPAVQARHDLKRLKMFMETGEIATSARRKDQTRAAKMEEEAA
ncbi:SRPBCC family protein [Croceibacterium sp. TMG7-5b_MA50]|uniref:SRPBCC family protein n=1 Tax=Croceibacterium sp. TMG7-5b_MA50 TaxID=3121290 RepID=UPI003222197E